MRTGSTVTKWARIAAVCGVWVATAACESSAPIGDSNGAGSVGGSVGVGGSGGFGGTSGFGGSGGFGGAAGFGGSAGGTSGVGGSGGFGGTGGVGGAGGTSGVGGTAGTGGFGGTAGGNGGTGGNTAIGSNRVTAGQWCQRLAEIQCAGESQCCTVDNLRYASLDACLAAQRDICETNFLVATIGSDPRVAYSVDRAEASLTTFESLTLSCDTTAAAWGASPDGLITMFAGTVGSGGSCTPQSTTDYAAGASCQSGLTCVPTSSLLLSWTCSPLSNHGGPCYADVNCVPGLHCQRPESRSTCVTSLPTGDSCTRATQCASLFCEGGRCVEATVTTGYCFNR